MNISEKNLAQAILKINSMSQVDKEALSQNIYENQPNLLALVLAQYNLGSTLEKIEVLLNILLVCYEAMKTSGKKWPIISESVIDKSYKRAVGRIGFIENLHDTQKQTAITQSVDDFSEKVLLAYVIHNLTTNGIGNIKTDSDKNLTLAALCLVESIALSN